MTDLQSKLSPPSWSEFCKEMSFESRCKETARVMKLHPHRIPTYVEFDKSAQHCIKKLVKSKYLVPSDMTLGQFNYTVRKQMECPPEVALFSFVGTFIPPTSCIMSAIYERHKTKDGFLVITCSAENTFGWGTAVPQNPLLRNF